MEKMKLLSFHIIISLKNKNLKENKINIFEKVNELNFLN